MMYESLPGVSFPVSRLLQGATMVGAADLDATFALLDGVLEAGGNAFDTAHVYGGGDCERALGMWVNDRGVRERVMILDKGAHFNADRQRVTPFDITADIHDSLARLKTDYIDLYLLHRDDPSVPVGPIVEVLNEHLRAGKIRAFGGSNWTHTRIAQANAYAAEHGLTPFAASSPQFSLAEMVADPWGGCISIGGAGGAAARAWYAENGMPVFAWSSLARGFFSGMYTRAQLAALPDDSEEECVGWYRSDDNLERLGRAEGLAAAKGVTVPQLALAYVLRQPMKIFALIGCRSADEFKANVEAFDIALTDDELAYLDLRA